MVIYVKRNLLKIICLCASIVLSILTFLLLDFSGLLGKTLLFDDNLEKTLVVMDLTIKFIIVLFIIAVSLNIYCGFNLMVQSKTDRKLYSDTEIVDYVSKYENLKEIILFGFSLSFAEELRQYLEKNRKEELEVTIYLPSQEYIKDKILENIPLESRLSQQSGRLKEWEDLDKNNMVKSLSVKRFDALPVANGTILNDEKCFLFTYNWSIEGNKVRFKKLPRRNRLKILIDSREKELWKYLKGNLCSYEEQAIAYREQTKQGKG